MDKHKMNIPKNWTFKTADIAGSFDKHVREQLPWYDLTTTVISHVARHYIPEGGTVYDIGASTGNIGRAISDTIEDRKAEFIPIDNSPEMAKIYDGPGNIIISDAADYNYKPFDLAIVFLCLMFIPPYRRKSIIDKLKNSLKQGGAIVIFDKCEPIPGYVGTIMTRLALAGKLNAGISSDEIIKKEMSLSGIQRPVKLVEINGAIEIFRFGDFAGWIIE